MKKVLSLVLAVILMLSALPVISVVAEGEVTGKIEGATLNIGSSLTLDYYATLSVTCEPIMRFTTSNGRVTQVKGEYDSTKKMYKFAYTGINPQCMTENISAELLVDNNVIATKEEYSVKAYCDSQITKKEADLKYTTQQLTAFRTLMADMLVYGAASQEYKEYNTSNLANASEWVNIFASTFASPVGVREVEGNADANNKVKSLGLNMANVNKIYFKLVVTDDVVISLNGNVVDKNTLIKNSDDTYTLYTDDIKATGFDDVYTLTIKKDGTVISTVRYNVNAYIAKMYSDGNVDDISKALYNYGASAEKYIQAMKAQTEGGDFDLGEEDVLGDIENILPESTSTFETASTFEDTGWGTIGTITTKELVEDDFGKCLHFVRDLTAETDTYFSPMLDINKYIKKEGIYTVTFNYKVEGATEGTKAFNGVLRTSGETSFAKLSGSNYLLDLGTAKDAVNGQWETFTATFSIEKSDFEKTKTMPWRLGMHMFPADATTDIYIDNFKITEQVYHFSAEENQIDSAETWVSNELVLISDKEYSNPFNDVDVDLKLTNGTTTYTVPGFWDGGNIWRVRFMCPTAGTWTYTTVCTDTENAGLHNKTNTFTCTEYSGDLDIYKHGFVKTIPNTKYFVYDDGTPFFYLGDTHWSTGGETLAMVEEIAAHRVSQGYNVWQSEPLGATFSFENGINAMDIVVLQSFDAKFKAIADAGMVHANAQFFFPSTMQTLISTYGGYDKTKVFEQTLEKDTDSDGVKDTVSFYDLSDTVKAYLEKISRYWVARYSSYPVMWTLGQEVDNDYYWETQNHNGWSYVNNPYRYVAEYIYKYDPYKSPLTGHQEGHTSTAASDSAFRDVTAHTWYASQWKPAFKNYSSTAINTAKDYWNNGQGKPVVNYEGRYCYLWTKDFGARAQGWMSFLSGMFGHGYGAQDTWCYLSTYSENENTDDGVDIVTAEEKRAKTWQDALEFESSYQMGYMKDFFEDTVGDWWNLIPRFNDTAYLTRDTGAYAYIASNADSSKIVAYFYNFSDSTLAATPNATEARAVLTGTFGNLQANTTYKYKWFNPRTAEYSAEMTFTSSANGKWTAPAKANVDMVLYIYK